MDDGLYWITILTDLLGAGASLWLAFYLLARGRSNRLTFRAVIMLLGLALFFISLFLMIFDTNPIYASWQTFSIAVALTAGQNLTHYLLPLNLQPRFRWIARGTLLYGLVTMGFLLIDQSRPRAPEYLGLYIIPVNLNTTSIIYGVFQILTSVAILINLRLILKDGRLIHNRSFYVAIAFGASSFVYGLIATFTGITFPRFIANLLILCAIFLLGYSIGRYQVLIERRVGTHDLPGTAITIFVLSAVYILAAVLMGLSPIVVMLVTVLAIFTHSIYDLIRDILDRSFQREKSELRRQLRLMTRNASPGFNLQRYLDNGLAILSHNLQATNGFIAVQQGEDFVVMASDKSLPLEHVIDAQDATTDELIRATGRLAPHTNWLTPIFAGGEQLGVIGIGQRKGQKEYTNRDLDWLEDIADRLGASLFTYKQYLYPVSQDYPLQYINDTPRNRLSTLPQDDSLSLVHQLDPEFVKIIEEGFRNLNDFIYLGESLLAEYLNVKGETHIERGKLVQRNLLQILETLRPPGKRPAEPPPQDWHPYIILKDAYVMDIPNREIMAELYIAERAFYRTRNKAIRGVARAILELENQPATR